MIAIDTYLTDESPGMIRDRLPRNTQIKTRELSTKGPKRTQKEVQNDTALRKRDILPERRIKTVDIYLFIYSYIHVFIYLSIYLFIYLLFIYLCIY